MLNNIIKDKNNRLEIIDHIKNLLIEVNNEIILPYFNNLNCDHVTTKTSDDDFVSIADKKSEEFISKKLNGFLKIKNFIGEEDSFKDKKKYVSLLNKPLLWVVDPIDGTKNYINGKESFCSMISLVNHSIPIAAFIFDPLKKNFVYAFKGFGAYSIDLKKNEECRLFINSSKSDKILGSGGTKGIPEPHRKIILNNLRENTQRLFIGSAGIETIMLVRNEIQFIFHGRVTPWDHSPVDLIIKEAGGSVYMAKNKEEFNIKSIGPILASSSIDIWEKVREIIIPKDNPFRNV